MAIYVRVSPKTREARRYLESIKSSDGKPKGKVLLKNFLNTELSNKLSSKKTPQSIIKYIETSNDSNITEFAKLLLGNEGNQKKFKSAVKSQAHSTGTKKDGLFNKLIYRNENLNFEDLSKSKIKAFLLAKQDSDINEDENEDEDEYIIAEEDKKSRRMKNKDIVEKINSGRLSNVLKAFMALVLWDYLKLKEEEQEKLMEKDLEISEEQDKKGQNKEQEEEEKKKKQERKEQEKKEESFIKEALKIEKNTQIDKWQKKHKSEIPAGKGDAMTKESYDTKLLREHLNEALEINKQGVAFSDAFFEAYDLPEWRTKNQNMYHSIQNESNKLEEIFEKCDCLKDLNINYKFDPETGDYSLKSYIFGQIVTTEGDFLSRIQMIQRDKPEIYNMFYEELDWISKNKDFLEKPDSEFSNSYYKDRLIVLATGLNGECSTELVSLIQAFSSDIDFFSQTQQGKKKNDVIDKSKVKKRVLTSVRLDSLKVLSENLASVAAEDAAKKKGAAEMPELQEIVRYQCSKALNVPSSSMNEDHLKLFDKKFDLVYKTNALSSIMNLDAIASKAVEYAESFDDENFNDILKQFDNTISYSLCCKILDRSSRSKLKKDKRSFNKRFRNFINIKREELFEDDLKLLKQWLNGQSKGIFEVFGIVVAFIEPKIANLLPECFLPPKVIFGYLIFIKYLITENIITLKS